MELESLIRKIVCEEIESFQERLNQEQLNQEYQQDEGQEGQSKINNHYKIYDDITKVSEEGEAVRSAFNMSIKTTERLKKFSQVRRIPLQDLVELAVINLLDEYDK